MKRFGLLAATAALMLPQMAHAAGDPAKGKAVFARCMACHATVAGRNGLGPTLAGVMGRKAGTVPGYTYSTAMKASAITWTPAAMDRYLAAPRTAVPGTKMIFMGLPLAADRENLIAWLATLKN
ncbi:c-type cytochrome [Sphingomonas solaris]|uniref:C-type cytochrome n=1 Tax=Alterirhizorhabdus solaris TaxID=2529389 RepID=A0A558RD60_9SPHN|nr:c-type cytochrome [Sphingomonas solaris]TVV77284.1 c-type cytochrome [Sphingomonas solaris]